MAAERRVACKLEDGGGRRVFSALRSHGESLEGREIIRLLPSVPAHPPVLIYSLACVPSSSPSGKGCSLSVLAAGSKAAAESTDPRVAQHVTYVIEAVRRPGSPATR